MGKKLSGVLWRLAIFTTVCLLAAFALLSVFAELRLRPESNYRAHFTNVSGLKSGEFVRIAGVEVGKVDSVKVQPDSTVMVEFSAEDSVVLTEGSRAVVRYENLLGDRYLALEEGAGSPKRLAAGATIPVDHTAPALDLDALIGGFRPLFRALDPEQVNSLSAELIAALQGQGATISSFLAQTASVTNTLADRDRLIGEVITNLHTVLGTLGDQSEQLDETVTSLSELVAELADRKTEVTAGVANTSAAAGEIADLLAQGRAPLKEVVAQTDRVSGVIGTDLPRLDNILNTLPDKYKLISAQGRFGDYFAFYLCDLLLKLNGKNGQPVYVKVAGQDTGRCAPR